MKIEDIKINRFKSLLNISINDIGNLTILVGKNGSGKTNILETLNHFFNDFYLSGGAPSPVFNTNNVWHKKRPSGSSGGGAIEITLKIKLNNEEMENIFKNKSFIETLNNNYRGDFTKIDICRQIKIPGSPWITKYIKLGNVDIIKNDLIITANEFNVSLEKTQIPKSINYEKLKAFFFQPADEKPDFTKNHFILLKNKAYPTSRRAKKLINEGKIDYTIISNKDFDTWVAENKLRIIKNPISRDLIEAGFKKDSIVKLEDEHLNAIRSEIENLVKNQFIYIQANRDVVSVPGTRVPFIDQASIINPFCKLIDSNLPAEDEETYRKIRDKIEEFIESELYIRQSPNEISMWEDRQRYSLENLGGGIQVIIGFMYQIYSAPKNVIFAIEEPENHLHPDFSRIFFNMLKEETDTKQIILTTHIPTFIDQTSIKNNWKVSKENNQTQIKRAKTKEDLVEILNALGARPVDRLYPNKVLLSCKTEKRVLSILAENLRYELDGVLSPLLKSDFDKRMIEMHAGYVKDTQSILVLVLDEDGKDIAKEAIEKGQVKEENCFVLDGSIEDEYPKDILVNVLKELFGVEVNEEDLENPVVEKIGKIRGVPGRWKIAVAESVAAQWKENIPKKLEDVLVKLHSKRA